MHKKALVLQVLWRAYYSLNTAVPDTANRRHTSKQVYYYLRCTRCNKQETGKQKENKAVFPDLRCHIHSCKINSLFLTRSRPLQKILQLKCRGVIIVLNTPAN